MSCITALPYLFSLWIWSMWCQCACGMLKRACRMIQHRSRFKWHTIPIIFVIIVYLRLNFHTHTEMMHTLSLLIWVRLCQEFIIIISCAILPKTYIIANVTAGIRFAHFWGLPLEQKLYAKKTGKNNNRRERRGRGWLEVDRASKHRKRKNDKYCSKA